jgi:hypothetical protein
MKKEEIRAQKRAWVGQQPKGERRRMRAFASALINASERYQGRVTTEGITNFMQTYLANVDQEEGG